MMRSNNHHLLTIIAATGILLATRAAPAPAQELLPFGPAVYHHDLQFFAPVELDLNNQPFSDDCGYFFNYDKLIWSFSGERYTVGDPNVNVQAERVYILRPQDQGAPPGSAANDILTNSYTIINGLQSVIPDAGFAFGDRYEFGYRDRGNGWVIGILDGPELNQNEIHGMNNVPLPPGQVFPELDGGELPPFDPGYQAPTNTPVSGDFLRPQGFGSVHINFATPTGFLLGFRDYLNFLAEAQIGTQTGPIFYVGNYGGLLEGTADTANPTITFFRLTDDIDGDLIPGSGFILDAMGNAILEFTDFDDLHEFNVAFDQVVLRTTTETNGVEAMWTHELDNRHYQAQHQNNRLSVAFGARFMKIYDRFSFNADGGILGHTFSETAWHNQIVGPQLAASWTNQRQRWRLSADAKFLFGYNIQDWDQINGIGEELIPGATNRLLFGQPTYSTYGLQRHAFSPVGELRVDAAYYVTQSVALTFGYTGMYVGHVRRAAPSVRYYLPDMGYREAGTQDLLVNGFNFGVEFVH
jgi:Putative beta barrel porin-7 (BBP7)